LSSFQFYGEAKLKFSAEKSAGMPVVVRAYGKDFDVDAFLAHCTLPVCAVKHLGEPVHPASEPDGRRYTESGVHVLAGEGDFSNFPRQVEQAIAFLRSNESELRRLCTFPGVEIASLDFGIERRDVVFQFDRLPTELLRLAGALGLDIEVSQYPTADKTKETG
jgi:hypothetical protein